MYKEQVILKPYENYVRCSLTQYRIFYRLPTMSYESCLTSGEHKTLCIMSFFTIWNWVKEQFSQKVLR